MKIKKGFVVENVAGSYLACATGALTKDFSGFVRLNATGAFLWNMLSEDKSREELIAALIKEYGISEELAIKDTAAFIEILTEKGFLE